MSKTAGSIAVAFDLVAEDIEYFRDRLARARAKSVDEEQVISAAEGVASSIAAAQAPLLVRTSFAKLAGLVGMLRDGEWRLEGENRSRVLDALSYFADPEDMIPDRIPGIGFLDDAIMIELVAQELAPEIEAYAEFMSFREERADADKDVVAEQRDAIQSRMRRRSRRMRTASSSGQRLSVFTVW